MPPKALYLRMTCEAAGRRKNAALADHDLAEAVGGGHLDRLLDDLAIVVASVAADDEALALVAFQRIEDRLDEVLRIVRLLEDRDLLPAGPTCRVSGPGRAWWIRI